MANDQKPVMLFARVEEWEEWLEAHPDHPGVRLKMRKKASTAPGITYAEALESALCFGWIDGPTRTFDERLGGLWFSPRRPRSGWAATNKARVVDLEATGEMTDAGRRAIAVARENGSWSVLDNSEALREPDDLAAALDADGAARAAWDAFPPSARKFGIAQVDLARRPATRLARITSIVTAAREGRRTS